jgi:hypothetical protein
MRPLPGRRTVAALVLLGVAAVGGCGQEDPTSDPAPSTSGSSSPSSDRPAGDSTAVTVAMVTGTAAGGEVDPTPVLLSTDTQIDDFVSQFTNPTFATQVERRAKETTVAEGRTLVGAVVSIGCEVPAEVTVDGSRGALRLTPVMPKSSPVQCFAPMTTVALVDVADAMLAG